MHLVICQRVQWINKNRPNSGPIQITAAQKVIYQRKKEGLGLARACARRHEVVFIAPNRSRLMEMQWSIVEMLTFFGLFERSPTLVQGSRCHMLCDRASLFEVGQAFDEWPSDEIGLAAGLRNCT